MDVFDCPPRRLWKNWKVLFFIPSKKPSKHAGSMRSVGLRRRVFTLPLTGGWCWVIFRGILFLQKNLNGIPDKSLEHELNKVCGHAVSQRFCGRVFGDYEKKTLSLARAKTALFDFGVRVCMTIFSTVRESRKKGINLVQSSRCALAPKAWPNRIDNAVRYMAVIHCLV